MQHTVEYYWEHGWRNGSGSIPEVVSQCNTAASLHCSVGQFHGLKRFDRCANVDVQSNALTATVTANGVVVMIGGGKKLLGKTLMLHMGMGLLDRKTGKLRYFAQGREDPLAMSIVGYHWRYCALKTYLRV